jgi:hypothetical protein
MNAKLLAFECHSTRDNGHSQGEVEMGREIRRVPKDWGHPKDEHGNFVPLHDNSYRQALKTWEEEKRIFDAVGHVISAGGLMDDFKPSEDQEMITFEGRRYISYKDKKSTFEEWHGEKPDPEDHRPDWPAETVTHYQFYENVSEGTPLSPVFETLQELEDWLVEVGDGWGSCSREAAQAFCKDGFAPSFIGIGGKLIPGVHAANKK